MNATVNHVLDAAPKHEGADPVKWWVWDDALPFRATDVPPAADACWEARYESDCERGKRAARRLDGHPGPTLEAVYSALALLIDPDSARTWSERVGAPVTADETLHGGGLHVTAPGGVLACHLDYARHPHRLGQLRRLNLIAFLHPEWRPEWGGELYLAAPNGSPLVAIEPRPGRVAAFEVSDLSYHGVAPTASDAAERVTAAAYFLTPGTHTRVRAQFFPPRGPFAWPEGVRRV